MYDDDRDTLAAEYVLGTLAADERDQAEALLAIDPGFAEIVRQWERRLGELNVMVEAVEPPPEVWEKIRAEIGSGEPRSTLVEAEPPSIEEAAPHTAPEATPEMPMQPAPDWMPVLAKHVDAQNLDAQSTDIQDLAAQNLDAQSTDIQDLAAQNLDAQNTDTQDLDAQNLDTSVPPQDSPDDLDDSAAVAALASSLLPPEAESQAEQPPPAEPPSPAAPKIERSADIIYLARRVRRWRGLTLAAGAIAALLAIYIGVEQFAPDFVPLPRPSQTVVASRPQPPATRFVAVLQHDPTAPAFLLTLDPQNRTLTVRRVAAGAEADRSYELWLISSKYPNPRSLGLVGSGEFTARPIPANIDADTVRGASYAISLEPAGGSPSGVPTGPILFTGKLVESLPASLPPS